MATKWIVGLLVAACCMLTTAPNAEARFGSRYASAPGWRPGKVLLRIRHANADRRQARRAEGRGLLPGHVARSRMASCGSCSTSIAVQSCPSCPSSKTTTTVTETVTECPNGVCPKTN